jgi:lipoprotein-anchoring transpeptidase ErfK/SrfK
MVRAMDADGDDGRGWIMRRPGRIGSIALLVTVLGLAGCSGGGARFVKPGASADTALGVTPPNGATDVPVSIEIAAGNAGGNAGAKLTAVALTDAAGTEVAGRMRGDASSWVPDEPLDYATRYTVKATGRTGAGKTATRTTTFTTMARPGNRMDAHLYMTDNATYGQAMPLVVEFKQGGVVRADRAAVERRLFVTSDPPQTGSWHWDNDIQIEYRPKDYWLPGTKINARLGLGGLPVGGGRYGQQDITIDAVIDSARRVVEVDNATKQLTAESDDQVAKTMPVSLGSPEHPSFFGTMVVMDRLDKTTFDSSTYGTPVNSKDGYRTDVQFAERLTWDGQFIHAAPWSVAQQGHTNVSHGCVNVATDNAQWLYNWIKVGDPIVVKGTEQPLNQGNGWTAWNLSWDDLVRGSALGAASPGATPSPSPS